MDSFNLFLCSWKPHLKCAHTWRRIRSHGWCYNWNTRARIINSTSYFPPLTQHELCRPLHFPARETHCLELYTLFNCRVFMVRFSHLRGKSCLSLTTRRHSKLLPTLVGHLESIRTDSEKKFFLESLG